MPIGNGSASFVDQAEIKLEMLLSLLLYRLAAKKEIFKSLLNNGTRAPNDVPP